MPALSTRTHGVLDYVAAAVLIVLPWPSGLRGAAAAVPTVLGAILLLYSLATDYELGALRRLQMPVHLWGDAFLGVLLAVSPWLFSFDRSVWLPHLIVGLLLVAAAVFTRTIPGYERRRA
ncbi:MAG TPA: SPW repeat protein [Longimicrobiaceae bacterium]|nr:SPW repeat protein [Longimicrobiaceae bacterium]